MAVAARPTAADLLAAAGRHVPDVIQSNLGVLFCGINPSLYSGFTGHHFARPGNRFWPALQAAGFTKRLLHPSEERELLASGCGITNLVNGATRSAAELTSREFVKGGKALLAKVKRYRPGVVAILGVSACRLAFRKETVEIGRQPEGLGPAILWVLPNPSGLNARYTPARLAVIFRALRADAEKISFSR
jgi:TDG/mug DNA glycosylase family protein